MRGVTTVSDPISVIMPVRNEGRHLAEAVSSVLSQNYPGEFEVVLAVGAVQRRNPACAARRLGPRRLPELRRPAPPAPPATPEKATRR